MKLENIQKGDIRAIVQRTNKGYLVRFKGI